MENIKLIALDLDGTLLDDEKRLSSRNEAVLRECIDRGIWIVPCTGRIWMGVPDFIRSFAGIRYAITVNGAIVEDVVNHRVLKETKLTMEQALEIIEMVKQFHVIMYDAYLGGQGYGETRFLNQMEKSGMPIPFQKMVRSTRKGVPDLAEEIRKQGICVEKVNCMFDDPEERRRAWTALEARGDLVVSSSYDFNLEMNAVGATKGEALIYLANCLGIPRAQTMGFGDGENDRTMMDMAGIGVCMANGMETVKQRADYITATNNDDGVAQAIETLVFHRER